MESRVRGNFELWRSPKVGLNSPESYIVVREGISYLRLLGSDPEWDLVTATASEDDGRVAVCRNKRRLIDSALKLGLERNCMPTVEKDWMKREYVRICVITRNPGQEQVTLVEGLTTIITRFFEIYDEHLPHESKSGNETRELYAALTVGDPGNDLYLGDGVWLSSDGSLHDRGR